jgi:hypothetical protein
MRELYKTLDQDNKIEQQRIQVVKVTALVLRS